MCVCVDVCLVAEEPVKCGMLQRTIMINRSKNYEQQTTKPTESMQWKM